MFGPAKITRLHVAGRDAVHEPRIIELPGVIVAPLSLELAHVALHERGELVTLELLLRGWDRHCPTRRIDLQTERIANRPHMGPIVSEHALGVTVRDALRDALVEAMCHEVDECLRDPITKRPIRDPHR